MKTLPILLLILSCCFLACNNAPNNKGIYIKLNNHTLLDSKPFLSFSCCGDEGFIPPSDCTEKNLRFDQVWQIPVSEKEENTKFLQVTIYPIKSDSIKYNLELFRVQKSDTLRIANFGGKKTSLINAEKEIRRNVCGFLNK
ncbi:MAG: Unknown protein [uncultured Aureispira sp.]|uniref:Lipoprotein n=1 Tax=uncultured Aureispira sp. TaxID=1331704 RepID=A0A6S6U8L7_9BACT|nr:MAG: Unknown protein [uncultured Aureispira sp.]